MKYVIDFAGVETAGQMHEALKRGLELPEYYGRNLDALWDCLTGEIETPCEIHIKGMGGKNEMMTSLLEAAAEMMREAGEWHGKRGRAVEVTVEQ